MMLIVSVKKRVIASMLSPFHRALLLQKKHKLRQLLSKQPAEKECYASCRIANHGKAIKSKEDKSAHGGDKAYVLPGSILPEVLDYKVSNKQGELSYEG